MHYSFSDIKILHVKEALNDEIDHFGKKSRMIYGVVWEKNKCVNVWVVTEWVSCACVLECACAANASARFSARKFPGTPSQEPIHKSGVQKREEGLFVLRVSVMNRKICAIQRNTNNT